MTNVHVPRYRVPARVGVGKDGIPDYVCSIIGAAGYYQQPPGRVLIVSHNGVDLRFVAEANRAAGWAVGFHYVEHADGSITVHRHDENGVAQQRFYEGVITFRLIPRG